MVVRSSGVCLAFLIIYDEEYSGMPDRKGSGDFPVFRILAMSLSAAALLEFSQRSLAPEGPVCCAKSSALSEVLVALITWPSSQVPGGH